MAFTFCLLARVFVAIRKCRQNYLTIVKISFYAIGFGILGVRKFLAFLDFLACSVDFSQWRMGGI